MNVWKTVAIVQRNGLFLCVFSSSTIFFQPVISSNTLQDVELRTLVVFYALVGTIRS